MPGSWVRVPPLLSTSQSLRCLARGVFPARDSRTPRPGLVATLDDEGDARRDAISHDLVVLDDGLHPADPDLGNSIHRFRHLFDGLIGGVVPALGRLSDYLNDFYDRHLVSPR